jgi:hypothetical protein
MAVHRRDNDKREKDLQYKEETVIYETRMAVQEETMVNETITSSTKRRQ